MGNTFLLFFHFKINLFVLGRAEGKGRGRRKESQAYSALSEDPYAGLSLRTLRLT